MTHPRPFRRTCRPFKDGDYISGGRWTYIREPGYARNPEHYTRAFVIVQKDLIEIFDYIEPSDRNLKCYSYRIHGLFMRTCIEIEANCRAILLENDYQTDRTLNVCDFRKLQATHRLSEYNVRFPVWNGTAQEATPYSPWASGSPLLWYQAYNAAKHDRQEQFKQANLENLLQAVAGLFVILSAQFHHFDFTPSPQIYEVDEATRFETGIGGYLQVRFPVDWPETDRYGFDIDMWKRDGAIFDKLTF